MRRLLFALALLVPGCLDASERDPRATRVARVDLVLVSGSVAVSPVPDGTLPADLGAHCAQARVAPGEPRLTILAWDGNATPPEGAIVRLSPEVRGAPIRFASTGAGERLWRFSSTNGTIPVTATLDPERVLASVSTNAPHVLVDGVLLGVGESRTLDFTYAVGNGRSYTVNETLAFHRYGPVGATLEVPASPCI